MGKNGPEIQLKNNPAEFQRHNNTRNVHACRYVVSIQQIHEDYHPHAHVDIIYIGAAIILADHIRPVV